MIASDMNKAAYNNVLFVFDISYLLKN